MFISIIQNEVLLSEGEAYQCTWAATANWTGGKGKNLEIDLNWKLNLEIDARKSEQGLKETDQEHGCKQDR